jgi:hypothetical protein
MGHERRMQKQQRMGRLCKWWKETREARSLQMTEDGGLQDATMPEDAEVGSRSLLSFAIASKSFCASCVLGLWAVHGRNKDVFTDVSMHAG